MATQGDVESWARTIEEDMRVVSSTLEYTYKVNLHPQGVATNIAGQQ